MSAIFKRGFASAARQRMKLRNGSPGYEEVETINENRRFVDR